MWWMDLCVVDKGMDVNVVAGRDCSGRQSGGWMGVSVVDGINL